MERVAAPRQSRLEYLLAAFASPAPRAEWPTSVDPLPFIRLRPRSGVSSFREMAFYQKNGSRIVDVIPAFFDYDSSVPRGRGQVGSFMRHDL